MNFIDDSDNPKNPKSKRVHPARRRLIMPEASVTVEVVPFHGNQPSRQAKDKGNEPSLDTMKE